MVRLSRFRVAVLSIALVLASAGIAWGAALPKNSITSKQLKNNAVTGPKIKNSAVGTAKLGNSAVTAAKIRNGAVTSAKLAANAVGAAQLAPGAVSAADLATGSVGAAALADGAVTGAKIADGAISTPKLANDAVTTEKVANGAITGVKLAVGSVDGTTVADGTLTGDDIANAAVGPADIGGGSNGQILTVQAGDTTWAAPDFEPKGQSVTRLNSGGTALEAGTRLIAKLAEMGPGTANEPRTLLLEAGTYDLGSTALTLGTYVNIVGLGNPVIIGAASPVLTTPSTSLNRLKDIGIETNNLAGAKIILRVSGDAVLDGVRVATVFGPVMNGQTTGIEVQNSVELIDSSVNIQTTTGVAYGIDLNGDDATLRSSSITARSDSAGNSAYGVQALSGIQFTALDSEITGIGGATGGGFGAGYYAILVSDSTIVNSRISGSGQLNASVSAAFAGPDVTVDNSRLQGLPIAVAGTTLKIGGSRLVNPLAGADANIVCAASYDGNYVGLDPDCTL